MTDLEFYVWQEEYDASRVDGMRGCNYAFSRVMGIRKLFTVLTATPMHLKHSQFWITICLECSRVPLHFSVVEYCVKWGYCVSKDKSSRTSPSILLRNPHRNLLACQNRFQSTRMMGWLSMERATLDTAVNVHEMGCMVLKILSNIFREYIISSIVQPDNMALYYCATQANCKLLLLVCRYNILKNIILNTWNLQTFLPYYLRQRQTEFSLRPYSCRPCILF